MAHYIAVIHKEKGSDFGVSFPDFPGCITAGATIDEAKDMAQEALELHIEGMQEDGDAIPAPMLLEDVVSNPDYAGAAAYFVVNAKVNSRAVRFNATMPEDLLSQIDRRAKKLGMTRSGFLAEAAKHEIARLA